MRDHKDLDMSVFDKDSAKLIELLSRKGFGVFVTYDKSGRKLMRRATAEELSTPSKLDLSICKIGANGKIERGTNEPFNFVDLHILSKDSEGNTVIGYTGSTLPKEYFEPFKKELTNGKAINLSQPAVVAYHKLHSGRLYDFTDLRRLKPYLQEKDFVMLRRVLEKEAKKIERMVTEKVQEVWNLIFPLLRNTTSDPKVISERLFTHPDLKKNRDNKRASNYVSLISRYVSENPGISFNDFLKQSLTILEPRVSADQKLELMEQLEKS
jgi:hypothetical protein